jgi:hypothetical protein
MPPRKRYSKETRAGFKKRMTKTGAARKRANKAAKKKK